MDDFAHDTSLDYELFKDLNESRRPIRKVFEIVRAKLGFTQEEVALGMNMSRMAISNIESGVTNRPTNETLRAFHHFVRNQGYYLSFDMLVDCAEMGQAATITAGDDIWFDDFAAWYMQQPKDLRLVLRFVLEAIKRLVEYFWDHYT